MQLPDPTSILKHIWENNESATVIMAHTIFDNIQSSILTPFKNNIFKYLPIFETIRGKALTFNQTYDIIDKAGGNITGIFKIKENKFIIKCNKAI